MSSSEPRVLNVGQCGFDHGNISRMLEEAFDARVEAAATATEALEMVGANTYDLILVNRILDGDGSDGVGLIQQFKAGDRVQHVPVMLISNFDDAQQRAVEAGAEPGFGKSDLDSQQTQSHLERFLSGA